MDRIVVMERGKVVESGETGELLEKENGRFRAMAIAGGEEAFGKIEDAVRRSRRDGSVHGDSRL